VTTSGSVPDRAEAPLDTELALAESLLAGIGAFRRRLRRTQADPFGSLTEAQMELLRVVHRRPDMSVTSAAAELRLAANTVSTLVRQLSAANLLVRRPDPDDRRVARLRLTDEARERLARWRYARARVLAEALRALPEHERAALTGAVSALATLTRHFDEEEARRA
jgi:DNA-binding MarR family transcriptional regulator